MRSIRDWGPSSMATRHRYIPPKRCATRTSVEIANAIRQKLAVALDHPLALRSVAALETHVLTLTMLLSYSMGGRDDQDVLRAYDDFMAKTFGRYTPLPLHYLIENDHNGTKAAKLLRDFVKSYSRKIVENRGNPKRVAKERTKLRQKKS